METKNLSHPQADTDAQFVTFSYPAESKERLNGNPALGERMIFLRKAGSVSPKETIRFSERNHLFLRKKPSVSPKETIRFSERNYLFLRKFSTVQVDFLFVRQKKINTN